MELLESLSLLGVSQLPVEFLRVSDLINKQSLLADVTMDRFLLVADSTNGGLFQYDLRTGDAYHIYTKGNGITEGIAYHPMEKTIYWSEKDTRRLRRISLDGQDLGDLKILGEQMRQDFFSFPLCSVNRYSQLYLFVQIYKFLSLSYTCRSLCMCIVRTFISCFIKPHPNR